ncbi:MAG: redoxin domain-containing protein [Nitrososphaerales archaeon]|jgi:thiol-disulfide isomerase/thioredoxin
MKINAYLLVFGVIGIIILAAGLSALVPNQGSTPTGSSTVTNLSNLPNKGPAPNFKGIAAWINSAPLNISELRGRVVLIDFWTYSCINCLRTIPYLNAWYSKYGNDGLMIVGVHTPEFQFEKNYSNVLTAVKSLGIEYAVALDSYDATWNAYRNSYWPTEYLIDKNGDIRDVHIGEGGYNATEVVIQELLENASYKVSTEITANSVNGTSVNFSKIATHEIYLGYLTSATGVVLGSPGAVFDYNITGPMENNTAYLSGKWYDGPDSVISESNNSEVLLIYKAKSVNIVAQGNASTINVELDGNNLTQTYLGSDLALHQGVASASITSARLYNIIDGPSYEWHVLEITASPGFRLYTFTFG